MENYEPKACLNMLNASTANYGVVKSDKLPFLVTTKMAFRRAHTSVKPSQCPLVLTHTAKYKIHALFHEEFTKLTINLCSRE